MEFLKRIQIDWRMNVGEIAAILTFCLGGVAAYYDLKSDVRNLQTKQAIGDLALEKFIASQKETDQKQDVARENTAKEVKESLRDAKNDITQEIRDLRSDFMRNPAKR